MSAASLEKRAKESREHVETLRQAIRKPRVKRYGQARLQACEGRNSEQAKQFGVPLDTAPMEARSGDALPEEAGEWQYEPKWDGFRCLAFKAEGAVELRAKSGKPLESHSSRKSSPCSASFRSSVSSQTARS